MRRCIQHTSHCESADEQSYVSSPDHYTLTPVSTFTDSRVLVLPRSPDPHKQNHEIENHDSHEALDVDRHPSSACIRIKCDWSRTWSSWRKLG